MAWPPLKQHPDLPPASLPSIAIYAHINPSLVDFNCIVAPFTVLSHSAAITRIIIGHIGKSTKQ